MKRERLTITLDTSLLQAVDTLIDHQILRNRSQTIEHLLKEGLELHETSYAFIFFETNWNPTHLSHLITLFIDSGVSHLFLAAPSQAALNSDLPLIVQQYQENYPNRRFDYTIIPADFGSGGAVLLQQDNLTKPFYLAWAGSQPLPLSSLLPFYTFHRQHHQPLTLLIQNSTTPLALANPDLIKQIPPGLSSLRQTVFPQMVKTGTVRGYLVG